MGTWAFIGYVEDGTHLRLYVNGEMVAESVDPPPSVPPGDLRGDISFATIGAAVNVPERYSYGFIDADFDEMRFYSAALTGSQIQAIMRE